MTTELKGNSATAARHGSGRRFGLSSGLVVLQVALSVVVLSGAGLLLRTLDNLRNIDPGFDTRNVLLFSIEPEVAGFDGQRIQEPTQNCSDGWRRCRHGERKLLVAGAAGWRGLERRRAR